MNFKTEEKRIDKLIQDGLVRLELGQVAEALLEFESALFFDSENLAANCLAATCLSRLERPAEAEALIQKAIALAPGLALPHLVAAEVMEATGRQDQAEFHLMEGVSKEPHNAGLRVELGRFLIQSSRPKEACEHLRQALEISPKQADARLLFALALAQQHRWDEAETEIESLGGLEKVDAASLALAGWLRMLRADDLNTSEPKLEEYKRAVELLTRANQIDPSIEFARELLAFSTEAVERVSKPADALITPPRRLRRAAIALGFVIYAVAVMAGSLWLANYRDFSALMLGTLSLFTFYLVLLLAAGFIRRDLSFLPTSLFMFIDRATKGRLTRWSNPIVTELFGGSRKELTQPTALQSEERMPAQPDGPRP